MIELVFAILMIQNGKVIEYVPTSGMAECLEQKRIVTRQIGDCLLYTSPSPRDPNRSRMPSSA